jgi:stringent starvation protein A
MTLFSNPTCPHSHRVRIVLAEKGISLDVVDVEASSLPEDLLDLNPYNSVPTLVDRDLVLYDSRVIAEYLDERFPHPPLMPVDPVSRARFRLALYHVERDWYSLVEDLERGDKRTANRARKNLRESLLSSAELFGIKPYFMSDEFSLVDCSIAPILWRLPRWEVDLPPSHARNIIKYAETLFRRPSFRASLTELEQEMRP